MRAILSRVPFWLFVLSASFAVYQHHVIAQQGCQSTLCQYESARQNASLANCNKPPCYACADYGGAQSCAWCGPSGTCVNSVQGDCKELTTKITMRECVFANCNPSCLVPNNAYTQATCNGLTGNTIQVNQWVCVVTPPSSSAG